MKIDHENLVPKTRLIIFSRKFPKLSKLNVYSSFFERPASFKETLQFRELSYMVGYFARMSSLEYK